eukprot:1142466-Pelagomonas_calceolata.AAC.1
MVRSWTAKSLERAPPDPGPSKGIHKSMLLKFASTGAVPGAWGGRPGKVKTKTFGIFAPKPCPLHPRSSKLGRPDRKVCLASMPSFKAEGGLAGSGQELPTKLVAHVSTAWATASHAPLALQGCQAVLFQGARILNSIREAQHAQHKAPTLARNTGALFSSHYFDLV